MEPDNIKNAGLKVTLPRKKILEILEQENANGEKPHMSAENIYNTLRAADQDIGLATVYRVLTQFEAAGLIMRHHFETGQAVFELNEGSHHDHLVCTKCGKVVEFIDEVIEKRQADIAQTHGFKLVDHSMILYGECIDPCH